MDDQNKIKRNKHFKTIRSSCLLCGDKALSHCYSTEMGNYKHIMALCSQCKLIQAVETDWPAVTELPTHLVEYHYKKPNESIQVFGCNCNDASLKNHKKKYSKYISKINKYLHIETGGRLLDVGCSTGHFLEFASQRGFQTVHGIETSPNCLAFLKQHDYIQGFTSFNQLPADCTYDVISFMESLMFFVDINRILHTAFSCLEPGGILLIEQAVNRGAFFAFVSKLFGFKHYKTGTRLHYWGHRGGVLLMSPTHLVKFLEKNGFRVLFKTNKWQTPRQKAGFITKMILLIINLSSKLIECITFRKLLLSKQIVVYAQKPSY